ncbi:MAG: sulfite exporter TauE/SafE family protein [Bacteroidetes bacterium]|nr:MAG: sulfite exporter TauE/SafE family protein [Bacteroidota bacterium]PTM13826.1 MAG: sulfite exporter TauE/SafE family protein [Bacteroidota bacterium]
MLFTAFIFGLLGSLHCVGMCGPLALALPFGQQPGRVGALLLYNFGRITTYTAMGGLMGFLGQGVFLVGLQSWVSLLLGGLLLAIGLFSVQVEFNIWNAPLLAGGYVRLKSAFARLVKQTGFSAIFSLGMLNGLLPCGLVYLALAGALTVGNWWAGMLYMTAFGLGTLPLLLTFTLLGQRIGKIGQGYLRRAYPIALAGVGIFLIWRALQFQLPANFSLWEALNNAPMCH